MSKSIKVDVAETRANRYALRCFYLTIIAFFVNWVINQVGIFQVDKKLVSIGLLIVLVLFAICIILCRFLGFNNKYLKYVLMFFIVAITTAMGVMLTYHAVMISMLPIVYSAMYYETKKMTTYTYILTVISIIIIVFAGYFIGLCDANMVLLPCESLSKYISSDNTFILNHINDNPLFKLSLYFILPRCVICGVFVPVCINISSIIRESHMEEEAMRELAEIDGMTGLFNKSKYLDMVANTFKEQEKIGVIFWDVNGLKQINDTLGHEYGDKLIVVVAECIKKLSSYDRIAYRIGGDEFVMVLRGADEAETRNVISLWNDIISDKTINKHIKVTASVGYAWGLGKELHSIIKRADEKMYEEKREYYQATKNL